jgi:hypothetical protein
MNEFPNLEFNLGHENERTFHRRIREQRERNNRMDPPPLLPPVPPGNQENQNNQQPNLEINQQPSVENQAENPILIASVETPWPAS